MPHYPQHPAPVSPGKPIRPPALVALAVGVQASAPVKPAVRRLIQGWRGVQGEIVAPTEISTEAARSQATGVAAPAHQHASYGMRMAWIRSGCRLAATA